MCVHMRHACTRILPLTNPYSFTLSAAALHWPRMHTVPGPSAFAYHVPAGVKASAAPLQRARERCHPAAVHLSPPTSTHAGDPKLVAIAANGCGSTAGVVGCAGAPAEAVASLSTAR